MYANNLFTLNNISTLSPVVGESWHEKTAGNASEYHMTESDRIMISICQYGKELFSQQLAGYKCVADVVCATVNSLGTFSGLFTLRLRNPQRGWVVKRTVNLRKH